jgi:hypothetical protein
MGDYFEYPLIEINKTSVKNLRYNSIPVGFNEYFSDLQTSDIWDIAGQYKLTITNHENRYYLLDLMFKIILLIILVMV